MSQEAVLGAEAEEEHWHPPYTKIFLALVALTSVEIAAAWMPREAFLIMVSLMVVIGIWKIALIGGYFMHLKFDQRMLTFIAAVPIVFGTILALGLLMEYFMSKN
jgi:caa(3)-type oxidase subunit IV